jgi:hypothetical protein
MVKTILRTASFQSSFKCNTKPRGVIPPENNPAAKSINCCRSLASNLVDASPRSLIWSPFFIDRVGVLFPVIEGTVGMMAGKFVGFKAVGQELAVSTVTAGFSWFHFLVKMSKK